MGKQRVKDLSGRRFGRLVALEPTDKRINGKTVWICQCDCGNRTEVVSTYLTSGETGSCGCLKKEHEQKNLREEYEAKRVDAVAMHLFARDAPRSDSSTGYRGVIRYRTRVSGEERYKAWITVNGKKYYKGGFRTAEAAYRIGRKELEEKHLPKK